MNLRRMFALSRLLFQGTVGTLKTSTVTDSKRTTAAIWFVIVLCAVNLLGQETYFYYSIGRISGARLLLEVALGLGVLFSLLGDIPSLLSNMYQETDPSLYFPLPILPRELVISRLVICYLRVLPFGILPALPALLVGLFMGLFGAGTFIAGVLLQLVISAGVLGIMALLIFLDLRAERMMRVKGVLASILTVAVYVMVFGSLAVLQVAILPMLVRNDQYFLAGIIKTLEGLVGGVFDSGLGQLLLAAMGLGGSALTAWVVLLLSVGGCLGLAVVLFAQSYQRTAFLLHVAGTAGGKAKAMGATSLNGWLLRREWWTVSDQFFFVSQWIQGIVIPPIATGITVFTAMAVLGVKSGHVIYDAMSSFQYLDLAVVGLVAAMAVINNLIPTAISREGKYFYISKVIPVPYGRQYQAKFYAAMISSAIATTLGFSIVFYAAFPLRSTIGTVLATVALVFLVNTLSLAFDLNRPVLHWTHPQQAANANPNTASQMGLAALLIAAACGAAFGLFWLGLAPSVALLTTAALALLVGVAAFRYMCRWSERKYSEIQF